MEEEAQHLAYLGSDVAPEVYMFGQNPDGTGRIVMEHLTMVPEGDLLLLAIQTLYKKVWSRPAHPMWNRKMYWAQRFQLRFGFEAPDWVNEPECCVHGDPTLANMCFDGLKLRFIDPKPPGNGIPPFASVDLGKIMQSYMGWERALFWQSGRTVVNPVDAMMFSDGRQQLNPFPEVPNIDLRRATFWCMIHFLRIVHREGKSGLGYWAAKNVRALQELVGMGNDNISLGPGWDAGGDEAGDLSGLSVDRD